MKSMKKLVLVGLVLLASVMVLAGCKNDSVPEVTPAKLVSITATPPTRTVYSVGESFDSTGMVVTAKYDDGMERQVEGKITSDTSTLTDTAGINKSVTVSYTEGEITKQSSFTVVVFPEGVQVLTNYKSPNNTDDSWTYVAFGEWPQSEAKDVEEDSLKLVDGGRGYFNNNYYKDDNDNYYVKHNDSYYKVEPIVWRVLNKDDSTGKALLLAEKILTGGIPYYSVYDVKRTIEGVEIFPNNYEHSQIRAFLNGLSYEYKESDSEEQSPKNEYEGKGFLQTAFTGEALKCIAETTVDNTDQSTNPNSNASQWNSGSNPYACTNTSDKIFLLSEQEATTAGYGFGEYSAYGEGNTRIRVTTDYAQATGAYQDSTAAYGGWWWLRSPYFSNVSLARFIFNFGYASSYINVGNMKVGVVPALSISMNGN